LVDRELTIGIRERIDAQGAVVEPLSEAAVYEAVRSLGERGVEAVGGCFLFRFRNCAHEKGAQGHIPEVVPQSLLSISSAIYPQYREYERTSTTAVNCYLGPRVSHYIDRMASEARSAGVAAPLQLMQSNGGIIAADEASKAPCRIVESGPAAGVIAAG